MTPAAASGHQQCARRLANLFEASAPDDLEVVEAVNVRVAPSKILIPDLVVARWRGDTKVYDPTDVLLVVEVISPSTTTMDRSIKTQLYAAARIRWYLMVEQDRRDGFRLVLHELAGDAYAERARTGAGEKLRMTEPFEVTVDPAALVRRRG